MIKVGTLIKCDNGFILEYRLGGLMRSVISSSPYSLEGHIERIAAEIEQELSQRQQKSQPAAGPADQDRDYLTDSDIPF